MFRLPAENTIALPHGVPPSRAVLAANMETALNVVWDSTVSAGDRVAVIADKRVIAAEPLDTLTRHDHPWIQDYFGGPRGRAVLRQPQGG